MESRRLAISSLLSSRPCTPVLPSSACDGDVSSPLDSLAFAASLAARSPQVSIKRYTPSPPAPPPKKHRTNDTEDHSQPFYSEHVNSTAHYALQYQTSRLSPPLIPMADLPKPIPRLGPTEMLNQIRRETEAETRATLRLDPPPLPPLPTSPTPPIAVVPHRLSPVELRHQIQHETPVPVLTSAQSPPLPPPILTPVTPELKQDPGDDQPEPMDVDPPVVVADQVQVKVEDPPADEPPPSSPPQPVFMQDPPVEDVLLAEIALVESEVEEKARRSVSVKIEVTPSEARQDRTPSLPPKKEKQTKTKSKSGTRHSSLSLIGRGTPSSSKKSSSTNKQQRKQTPAAPNLASSSRSRSVSHQPPVEDDENDPDWEDGEAIGKRTAAKASKSKELEEEKEEESKTEANKLYCLCQTPYDEEIAMIACDRCDEWYHPECVELPEKMIELVDQFVCPICRDRNPEWSTTYKARCLQGVASVRPNSPSSCHNPARPPFSKYCSEECGIKYMERKIDEWEFGGDRAEGKIDRLWEAVKGAKKREAIVIPANKGLSNGHSIDGPPTVARQASENQSSLLNRRLSVLVADRTKLVRELELIDARNKFLEMVLARSEKPEYQSICAWDHRLNMSSEKWANWVASPEGESVLQRGGLGMSGQVNGMRSTDAVIWCQGRRKCERHAGWQRLCAAEVELDKGIKELALKKLTTKERDIRRRIEDIEPPPPLSHVNGNSHTSDSIML